MHKTAAHNKQRNKEIENQLVANFPVTCWQHARQVADKLATSPYNIRHTKEVREKLVLCNMAIKLKFFGTIFRVASSWYPRENVRNKSGVSGDFPVQLATRLTAVV